MYQEIELIGNLGRDPESRFIPSGKQVTSFSVAVNEGYGETKKTIWFRVSTWEKLAETCAEHLHKGSKVFIKGRMTADDSGGPRVWEKDGKASASFELTAAVVKFLDPKQTDSEDPF